MFGHAANRLQAVRARGVGGARGLTIFSEDARTMKPESYPWKTWAARAHRPTLPATTHTQCTLTYWLTNYRYANPSQRIQNNVSQNKSTGSPELKSRSLDTPHTRALCVTVWHNPGPRRSGGRPVKYPSCRRGGAPAALTSRAGCSHGGATRTAPRPPSRFRRAPTRLFSVPKIQDSDPASQSQRTCRPPPVTLPHTATPLFLLRSLTDEPATTSADVNIEQIDRSLI